MLLVGHVRSQLATAWVATVIPLERLAAKFKNLTHALQ
jgi:hypothetical protein